MRKLRHLVLSLSSLTHISTWQKAILVEKIFHLVICNNVLLSTTHVYKGMLKLHVAMRTARPA